LYCEFCGKEESLPFVCNYCGGVYCGEHRLPEAHLCKGDLRRKPVIVNTGPSRGPSWWAGGAPTYAGPTRRTGVFSRLEIRDIIIAWAALSAAFLLVLIRQGSLLSGLGIIGNFGVALVSVGSGFVLHELMHKFTAQRYGYWAEFRMWPFGIVFALVTAFIGFLFAAPGATYIMGYDVPDRENGIISLAGPATNIGIALCFLAVALTPNTTLEQIGALGMEVNLFLATFNLIPVMPLDGAKVWRWNKALWAGLFVPLAVVVALIFLGYI